MDGRQVKEMGSDYWYVLIDWLKFRLVSQWWWRLLAFLIHKVISFRIISAAVRPTGFDSSIGGRVRFLTRCGDLICGTPDTVSTRGVMERTPNLGITSRFGFGWEMAAVGFVSWTIKHREPADGLRWDDLSQSSNTLSQDTLNTAKCNIFGH